MASSLKSPKSEAPRKSPLTISYILPLRWSNDDCLAELTSYLRELAPVVSQLIIVDGSDPPLFARHTRAWASWVTHIPPVQHPELINGKVAGVLAGLAVATEDVVVIADDDVRWSEEQLRVATELAREADLVIPQNVFHPLPWHAAWDSARTVINRAFGLDYPGTLVVDRQTLAAAGGYRGDVLFENLELMRTIRAIGGKTLRAPDLYIRRCPPTTQHFWSQRVRQAYDDFAQPWRAAAHLALLPICGQILWAGLTTWLLGGLAALIVLAECGRRRHGGSRHWPFYVSLMAPMWILERAVCAWLAYVSLISGGVPYGGSRLRVAAHSTASLRRRQKASGSVAGTSRPALAGTRTPERMHPRRAELQGHLVHGGVPEGDG
jgi:hypothetical protein